LTSGQIKGEGPNVVCSYQPQYTSYGRFSTHYPNLRQYLEGSGEPGPNQPRPPQDHLELTSGRAVQVSLPAALTPTLYATYLIRVPQGATSLQISLRVNAEVGLAVSAGEPPKVVDGRVSADYYSPSKTGQETLVVDQASTPPLRPGVYYIGLANFTLNQAATGTLTATVETRGQPNPSPGAGQLLTFGVPANFSFGPVRNAVLINGEQGFRIQVPAGATRLEIRLVTATADADLDLYARFGADIELRDSDVIADHVSDSPEGRETIVITPLSSPALRAGTYYVGLGIFAQNVATAGTVTAIVTSDGRTPPPPQTGGNALTSGVPRQFNVPAVDSVTLLNDAQGFTIQVPQGATRLDIRLVTNPSDVDVDVYARFGQDVALNSGRLDADYDSSGPDGSESITITAQSNPPLKPGTYFIAFGLFATNSSATATVTATISGGGNPPARGRALTSGTPVTFFTNAQPREILLNGIWSYTIQVPQGATRLEIKLNTRPADFDMDLFARAGADPAVDNGKVIADHSSTGPDGTETIVITASSNPPLKPGVYYIALGVFTKDRPASGTLVATVTTGGGTAGNALKSDVPANFSFRSVDGPTLEMGQNGFYIDVPEGTTRLDVRLDTATAGADLDLYVRRGQDVTVVNGNVVSDFVSDGPTGSEAITVTRATTPPLQPGRYYVGVVIYTTGVRVSGTVTATVTNILDRRSGFVSLELDSETPARITLPAASMPYLYTEPYSYKLTVPEGVTRMKLDLRTETPGADVDLYVRYLDDVELNDGRVIADYGAFGDTGDEMLLIDGKSSPPLRPGVYYIAFANLTANTEVHSTLAVTLDRSAVPPQSSARVLEPDKPARFELPAVGTPSLFLGEQAFRVIVPAGTGRLGIKLHADDLTTDVELFVTHGKEATVEQSRVIADYSSTGEPGEEEIAIINPRAGVYFINLVTTGVAVNGTLAASLSSAEAAAVAARAIWKAPFTAADSGEPVAAKPAARAVLPLPADVKRPAPQSALSGPPALSKQARFKKLIPLSSLGR
jgi:Bacterial pre-peptidase C-terminal domain